MKRGIREEETDVVWMGVVVDCVVVADRGIAGLGRKFRIIDDDGNRQLSLSEFSKAIREHALGLSEQEVAELFRFIDTDGSGGINFDEFLLAIRVRRAVVGDQRKWEGFCC